MRFSGEAVPDRKALAELAACALVERGGVPWPETELDYFSVSGESLVIARPGPSQPHGFFFPSLECLLGGALGCGDGESGLYWADGGYVLTVGSSVLCSALYEFGQLQAGRGPLWQLHAQEQGQCILQKNAISELRRCFATGTNDCEIR
jgi:hypothetical protein